jgi:hypothetical protein
MPSERFKRTIPAIECPQTHAWDGAATGSAVVLYTAIKYFLLLKKSKVLFIVFKLSPRCCNDRLSSGYFPGVWVLKADVSEHCRFHIQQVMKCESHFITCWRWNRHSVPKRRILILRRRGNIQKTIYQITLVSKLSSKENIWRLREKKSVNVLATSIT